MSNLLNGSKDDPNNSGTYSRIKFDKNFMQDGKFIGTPSNTNGYNSLIISVNTDFDSKPCGLIIQFSDTGTDFENSGSLNYSTVFYSDSVFANSNQQQISYLTNLSSPGSGSFIKSYPILRQYYRIVYYPLINPTIVIINSRLSTQTQNTLLNSTSTFENNNEKISDALDKLRVTYPTTILDLHVPFSSTIDNNIVLTSNLNLSLCWNYPNNILIDSTKSSIILNCTQVSKVISQSRVYCTYQSGKSFLFTASGIIGYVPDLINGPYNYYNRIGYFDDQNGFFFVYNFNKILHNVNSVGDTVIINTVPNNLMSVVIRYNGYDNIVTQDNWNIDKMDGYGPSGLIIDFTTPQIFVIDLAWLGFGRIRFGLYLYGKIKYCHQDNNINSQDIVYPPNINLPIRYEIEGIKDCKGTCTLTQISSSVVSEGGYNPSGKFFSVPWTGITSNFNSETSIFALTGYTNYYHQNIIPTSMTLASDSDIPFIYRLRLYIGNNKPNCTWSNYKYSYAGYSFCNLGNSFLTDSILLDSGVVVKSTNINFSNNKNDTFYSNNIQISSNVNNLPTILILTIQSNTQTMNIYGSMTWQEIY
jgi:hypothetical protein